MQGSQRARLAPSLLRMEGMSKVSSRGAGWVVGGLLDLLRGPTEQHSTAACHACRLEQKLPCSQSFASDACF